MKKTCIILMLLLPCIAWSEFSLGVNLATDLETTVDNNDAGNQDRETRTTAYNLSLTPTIIFVLNNRFEMAPYAGVSVRQEKLVRYVDGDETEENKSTDFGAGGGCGVFLRLVNKSVFRLSLGPEASFWFYNSDGDDNYWVQPSLALPLNLDLLITDRFFMRMKFGLFAFRYTHDKQNDNHDTDTFAFFNIATQPLPGFGFYFTF